MDGGRDLGAAREVFSLAVRLHRAEGEAWSVGSWPPPDGHRLLKLCLDANPSVVISNLGVRRELFRRRRLDVGRRCCVRDRVFIAKKAR